MWSSPPQVWLVVVSRSIFFAGYSPICSLFYFLRRALQGLDIISGHKSNDGSSKIECIIYLCVFYYLYLPCLDLKMELCYQLTILVQV